MRLKESAIILLIIAMLLTGCLNYKPYEEQDPVVEEPADTDLIDEIAEIEEELGLDPEEEIEEETDEEIIMNFDGEVDTSNLQRLTVKENELVDLSIKISDPDKDQVDYSFSLPLNEQGKWKTNYGDAGEYVVTITATDGKLTTTKDILLVVERVNVAPIIKEIKDITVLEGDIVKLEPQAIDPNGDAVTLTVSKPLDDGVWETDHTSAGEYEVTVTASDGEAEATESFLLTVEDVNMKPVISGLNDFTVDEGEEVELDFEVSDLDNDNIELTISDPVGDDGEWQTTYTDHGVYTITVQAFDGKDTVTETITLTVEDVNMPPEIVEIKLS